MSIPSFSGASCCLACPVVADNTPKILQPQFIGLLDFVRLEQRNPPHARVCLPALRVHLGELNIRRVSFHIHHRCACQGRCSGKDWTTTNLEHLIAQADTESGVVIVGAESEDVQHIHALRAQGRSVIAINWPSAFDWDLVQTANWSVHLNKALSRCLADVNAHLYAQAD